MNYFTQELKNIMSKNAALKKAKATYIGRICYIELTGGRRAKIAFTTTGVSDHYDALDMAVVNTAEGKIDSLRLRFMDYCAKRPRNCAGAYVPHIWVYGEDTKWYGEGPSEKELKEIAAAIAEYVSLFA